MKEFLRGAPRLHIAHHAAEEPVHGAWRALAEARRAVADLAHEVLPAPPDEESS